MIVSVKVIMCNITEVPLHTPAMKLIYSSQQIPGAGADTLRSELKALDMAYIEQSIGNAM